MNVLWNEEPHQMHHEGEFGVLRLLTSDLESHV